MARLCFLNAAVFTNDGLYRISPVSREEVLSLMEEADEIVSAIGHESTAEELSEFLGVWVPANRQRVYQEAGEKFICFKLNGRLPEGAILSREQIEAVGYELKVLHRLE